MRAMATNANIDTVVRRILSDIRVELSDEFDRNFERQGFFTQAWAKRKSPLRPGGPTLIDSGQLRRSIQSRSDSTSITFYSSLPYASIHNDGGEIKVTARMKRYFWHKYYEASGKFGHRKDGSLRKTKRNAQLGTEAEFWKSMALMKVGKTIKIPRRQFLGMAPEVETEVTKIIEDNLSEYFENYKL